MAPNSSTSDISAQSNRTDPSRDPSLRSKPNRPQSRIKRAMKRCTTKTKFKDATAGGGGLVRRPRWAVGTLAPQNLVIGARDNNLPRSSSGPMIEEVVENTAEAVATRKRAKRDEASGSATMEESKEVLPSTVETTTKNRVIQINGVDFMTGPEYKFYYCPNRTRENDIAFVAGKHLEE